MVLCMSGTWSGHANTMKHVRNLCKCVAHHQGWMSQPGTGAIQVSLDKVVVQTIGVPFRESIYKTTCISKKDYLTSLLYLSSHLWYFMKPVLRQSIIVTLDYTPSKCVKLLDHLSDPPKPLINQISSEISSGTSSRPVNSCFICIHVHRFPVCVPSFCKKGKPLKHKHWLLRKLLQR